MLNKWMEKRKTKQKKQAEKYKKPSLQEKLETLENKHGGSAGMKFVDGKVHYMFVDGTEIYFKQGFAGMEIVYVAKGFLYDLHEGY